MVLVQEEFHDLKAGDRFALATGGPVYTVDDADYIDYWGVRLIMYLALDGWHGHEADHAAVWLITD